MECSSTVANCLCGAVSYKVAGKVTMPRYCHCTNCQKFSGSAYAAWGVIEANSLEWISGRDLVRRFDTGIGYRNFCSTCGSPISYAPHANQNMLGIPLGALPDAPEPIMHLWTRSKQRWVDLDDGLAQHDTFPDR